MEPFAVDLISDLNLSEHEPFDWTGKPTSLFCVVAGNISDDLSVIKRVLEHLGDCYRGVFYIDGPREHQELADYESRILAIREICNGIEPVIFLHNHVIILNGIAFLGCNGWYGNADAANIIELRLVEEYRLDDTAYLVNSVKKLQDYGEVKQIVVITSSIPTEYLSYSSPTVRVPEKYGPARCLIADTNQVVTTWLFGSTELEVDEILNDRRFCNNPNLPKRPYWPKRIVIRQ